MGILRGHYVKSGQNRFKDSINMISNQLEYVLETQYVEVHLDKNIKDLISNQ